MVQRAVLHGRHFCQYMRILKRHPHGFEKLSRAETIPHIWATNSSAGQSELSRGSFKACGVDDADEPQNCRADMARRLKPDKLIKFFWMQSTQYLYDTWRMF